MIVLDTHAWLWWVDAPAQLSRSARGVIDSAEVIGVSAMSALEVATLVRKGRLALDRPAAEWIRAALAQPRVRELAITADIAVRAGSFGPEFHADPADRVIAATALVLGAPLVTKDEALRKMPMLQPVW